MTKLFSWLRTAERPPASRLLTRLTVRQNASIAASGDVVGTERPARESRPVLVESIRDALLELRSKGLALVVVEQNQLLASRADRLLRLVAGKVRDT